MAQAIGGFNPQSAHIAQTGTPAFAIQLLQPAQQPLDADEIPLRLPPGVLHQERGVPAAQFHLQRPGLHKQRRQIQRFQDGFELKDQVVHGGFSPDGGFKIKGWRMTRRSQAKA